MTLEKIMHRKQNIEPIVEDSMKKFLGVQVKEINEDISSKLVNPVLQVDFDTSLTFKEAKKRFKKVFITMYYVFNILFFFKWRIH